jgi:hypothetical protein
MRFSVTRNTVVERHDSTTSRSIGLEVNEVKEHVQ